MRTIDADDLKSRLLKDCAFCPNNGTKHCHLVCELNYYTHLIDECPTVELFCHYQYDGEVKEPCVEAPCPHERPQGDLISRDALKSAIEKPTDQVQEIIYNALIEFIDNAPTVPLRLMTVEECAGHTIDYAMGWKACIEWIKKGCAE